MLDVLAIPHHGRRSNEPRAGNPVKENGPAASQALWVIYPGPWLTIAQPAFREVGRCVNKNMTFGGFVGWVLHLGKKN